MSYEIIHPIVMSTVDNVYYGLSRLACIKVTKKGITDFFGKTSSYVSNYGIAIESIPKVDSVLIYVHPFCPESKIWTLLVTDVFDKDLFTSLILSMAKHSSNSLCDKYNISNSKFMTWLNEVLDVISSSEE